MGLVLCAGHTAPLLPPPRAHRPAPWSSKLRNKCVRKPPVGGFCYGSLTGRRQTQPSHRHPRSGYCTFAEWTPITGHHPIETLALSPRPILGSPVHPPALDLHRMLSCGGPPIMVHFLQRSWGHCRMEGTIRATLCRAYRRAVGMPTHVHCTHVCMQDTAQARALMCLCTSTCTHLLRVARACL